MNEKKTVLLVYPDLSTFSQTYYSGVGYLSTNLKKAGFGVKLIHIIDKLDKQKILDAVEKTKPMLIGFSCTTNLYDTVKLVAGWIKEKYQIPIICGGIHPTLNPEEVISNPNIDMVCVGEGEKPLVEVSHEIAKGKLSYKIKNVWFKKNGKVLRNPVRELTKNIDTLGFPDREIFNFDEILKKNGNLLDIMTSRGCPFQCTYCCNHALLRVFKGKGSYVRFRTVSHVIREIEEITKRYKIDKINLDDDTFTLNPEYVKEFCGEYKKRFNIPFIVNARVETAKIDVLKSLKEAGCEEIRFGIECGNEDFRKSVLKRFMPNSEIKAAFANAKKAGLKTYAYNIVGFPFETEQVMKDTLNLLKDIMPDSISVSIFYPYPGTELYRICEKEGLLTEKTKKSYFDYGTTLNFDKKHRNLILKYYKEIRNLALEQAAKRKMGGIYPAYYFFNSITKAIGVNFTPVLFHMKKIVDDYLL